MNTHNNEHDDSLWTVRDVAAFLKTSRSWVYQATADGTLPGVVRLGARLRFDPLVIKAWVRPPDVKPV